MAMAIGFAGCGGEGQGDSSAAAGQTTLERLRAQGKVRVGYANEAPYAYSDSASGRLTGEAPEIARVILKRMGLDDIDGVLTEFGSLIPGLKARRFDLIAAGMYITPERCAQIAFSNPSYAIGEAFIVLSGNPLGLHAYEDLAAHETATLGIVAGTVERSHARKTGIPDERVTVFPDPASAIAGVRGGRVSAYAGTSLTINDLMSKLQKPGLERAAPFVDPVIDGQTVRGYGAFGFRIADAAFREAFNAELAQFIGTPEHLALVKQFGFDETTLPGDVTAEQLCQAGDAQP